MAEVKIPDSLPWSANGNGAGSIQNSTGGWLTDETDVNERTAYIAHACNAYPALVEALKFYAKPDVYRPHPHGLAFDNRDVSYVARAALKAAGVET